LTGFAFRRRPHGYPRNLRQRPDLHETARAQIRFPGFTPSRLSGERKNQRMVFSFQIHPKTLPANGESFSMKAAVSLRVSKLP